MWTNRENKFIYFLKNMENKSLERENKRQKISRSCGADVAQQEYSNTKY